MRRRIMVVEDDPLHMKLFGDLLVAHDYEAIAIPDGRTAVAAIEGADPDLVIVDILLPNCDGRDVIRALRASPVVPGVPILAISAATDDDIAASCRSAGANDFYAKPIRIDGFMRCVEMLVRR